MERTYCPHCGTRWYLEELNFTLFQNINGYKFDGKNVVIETGAKKVKSNITLKCVNCGYQTIIDVDHL